MFCRYCGNEVKDNEKICSQCNQLIIREDPDSEVQKKPESQNVTLGETVQKQQKWEMDSPYGEVMDKRAQKQTKKHVGRSIGIGVATLSLILVLALLVNSIGNVSELFNKSLKLDSTGIDRPSLETLYTASPFYAPEINMPSSLAENHSENVSNKIKQILKITDEMMNSYSGLKEEVHSITRTMYVLLENIDAVHGTNYLQESEAFKKIEQSIAAFELQELKYYGLDIDKTDEALYDSDIAYARVASAVTACEKVIEAHQLLINYSSIIYASYEGDADYGIETMLGLLHTKFSESIADEYGASMMAGVDTVNELLLSLDAANAYLALDNLDYVKSNIEDVKEDVKKLEKSDLVDKEFVELSEMMVEEYEEMSMALSDELESYINELNFDMSYQKPKFKISLFKPIVAEASSDKYSYGAGYDVQMLQKDGQDYMREQQKAYQEKYKEESYWQTTVRTAKELRKGTQDVVENIDAATFEFARTVAGKYTPSLGNKEEDAYKDIQERYALAQKRKAEGKGGQQVFKEAVKGFEATQNLAGEGWYNIAAFWEDELGLPQDTVSQLASGMGNIAAESFTQFGQGLARILDPDAKNSDIAKGCFEVATSMVGGTGNVFSATKSGGKVIAKMGEIIASPKLHAKGVIDAVKAIKNIGLPQLGSLKYKEAAVKGTMAALKKSKEVAEKMVGKLDETFTQDISGIFMNNWKESLSGFRDYANRVGSNVDDHAVKLIDEFVNGYIDNKVTELASNKWLWDPNVSDEEKEAKIAEEIDKMNEEIDQGLGEIEEVLSDNILDGKYEGTWELVDIHFLPTAQDQEQYQPLLDMYRENIGVQFPCTTIVNGNIITLKMAPDEMLIYNDDVEGGTVDMNIEIILQDGVIMGAKNDTTEDIVVTSSSEKGKNTINISYYYTFSFEEYNEEGVAVDIIETYGITLAFKGERKK